MKTYEFKNTVNPNISISIKADSLKEAKEVLSVVVKDSREYVEQENEADEQQIYISYDPEDGEFFCAFDNRDRAEKDASEAGVKIKTITLHKTKK